MAIQTASVFNFSKYKTKMTKSRTTTKHKATPSATKNSKRSRSRKDDAKPKAKGRDLTDTDRATSGVNGVPSGEGSREFPDAVYLDR